MAVWSFIIIYFYTYSFINPYLQSNTYTRKKKPLYTNKTSDDILKLNRTLSLLIAIAFLYINIIDKGVKEENNLDLKSANLQIDAGILTVIASIIVLYVSFTGDGEVALENPED